MSIQIAEYQPDEKLQPFVELFWEGQFNTAMKDILKQKVVPNGYIDLIIHLSERHCNLISGQTWSQSPDYTIIGLYTHPYEVQFRDLVKVFGIRFKPESIFNLFGIPASVFSENYEDMELVLGNRFGDFCSRLREAESVDQMLRISKKYLMTQLEKHYPELNYVNRAAEIIRRPDNFERIDELPEKVFISLRQLEREFKQKIGVTPKRYMRIARLNEVHRKLENEQEVEFTKVALDCGYSDQAHFIRDFKSIMGIKPTLYFKNRQQFIVNVQSAEDVF